MDAILTLAQARQGARVRVSAMDPGDGMAGRLAEMGISCGTEIEILHSVPGGPVVVAKGDGRLALGAGMTGRIWVSIKSDSGNEKMQNLVLRDMKIGDSGRVLGFVKGASDYRRRLLSMGLTTGAEFKVTRMAPLGDPVEINLRGFSLSLRKDEAAILLVAPKE